MEKFKDIFKKDVESEMSKKTFWVLCIIIVSMFSLLMFGKPLINYIQSLTYLNKNNITEEVIKDVNGYKKLNEKEYVVYFYSKECEKCKKYSLELKKYEKKSKLNIYKVNLDKLNKDVLDSKLFIDSKQPYTIVLKDGEENFRYIGAYPIKKLP